MFTLSILEFMNFAVWVGTEGYIMNFQYNGLSENRKYSDSIDYVVF